MAYVTAPAAGGSTAGGKYVPPSKRGVEGRIGVGRTFTGSKPSLFPIFRIFKALTLTNHFPNPDTPQFRLDRVRHG